GVAAISIDYAAFLSPLLFWVGMGLLGYRLMWLFVARAREPLARLARPVSGAMAPLVISAMSRQPNRLAASGALIALALAFGCSVSIFNATYEAQAKVDAELTNGSDVTVTGTTEAPAGQILDRLSALQGVIAAVPMQHRFAYVGTDLQDLYGIDPETIGRAATMSNAYFGNGDAEATLRLLRSTPDGVLVSDETVTDFQLSPGDTINLRLQNAADHQYHSVPFHVVGIVREFPTAPSDSFLVANVGYVAKATGSDAAETVLMRVRGDPSAVRDAAREIAKPIPALKVRDITEAGRLIGSSLTAVDLRGLTRLELGFAVLLSMCAAGLLLALGIIERRRSFAIMAALGAKRPHLLAFLRSEALFVVGAGALVGLVTGALISWIMVKLLTGVFDPPPERLIIPWMYIAALLATTVTSVLVALIFAERRVEVSPVQSLRETAA
ncbi:MAG: ABC transporter permease, partial [Hyphomicrobiales bacterium]